MCGFIRSDACLFLSVEKMKLGLLHRLDSIPKEVKSSSSIKHEEGAGGSTTGSSTESSSDNESIIQELLRSASMEQEQEQEQEKADTEECL